MVADARRFNRSYTRLQLAEDACGDTVLKLEQFVGRSLEPLCPDRTVAAYVNQLATDPQACLLPLYAAIQDVANVEFAGDLTQVLSSVAIPKRRTTRDNV